MSDINSSLIGFLKKKSLFAASPEKNRKNKSKDKRQITNAPTTPKNNFVKTSNLDFNTQSSKNLHKSSQQNLSVYDQEVEFENRSMYQESPIRYEVDIKQERPKRNFNFKNTKTASKNPQERQQKKVQSPQTAIWSGLVNHATSFESARIESAQCLDSLSTKINAQISSINYKVDMFNSKMTQILNKQFKNLEESIYEIINHVFAQSQNNIRAYIKEQEQILAGELLMMKGNLEKELHKVESMRQDINKPNWRKVAGELLSTEMQTRIQELLKKSKSVDIGQWQVGDLGANKVNALQHQLRDIIKLSVR